MPTKLLLNSGINHHRLEWFLLSAECFTCLRKTLNKPCRNSEWNHFKLWVERSPPLKSILETWNFATSLKIYWKKTTMEWLEMNGTSDGRYVYILFVCILSITNHNPSKFNHDPLCTNQIYIYNFYIYNIYIYSTPSNPIIFLYSFGVEHQDF